MNKRIIAVCDSVIQYGLPVMGVCIVLALSLFSYDMLQLKATVLQVGSALVFGAWLIKSLEQGYFSFRKAAIPALIGSILFAGSAILSHLFVAKATDLSFDELIIRIPYFLIFIVAVSEYVEFSRVKRTVVWMTLSGVAAAIFGFAQHFQIDPFGLAQSFDWRIPSTFANPNFYVGFLVLLLPLVGAFFPWSHATARKKLVGTLFLALICTVFYYVFELVVVNRMIRLPVLLICLALPLIVGLRMRLKNELFFILTIMLLLHNLLLTHSRSGQIGFTVNLSVFVLLGVLFFWKARRWKKIALVSAVTITAIVLTVAGVIYFSTQRQHSVSERKFYVIGALDLIKQKPLLGHGIGTFQVNYPRVKRIEAWAYDEVCFQYARNVYNEILEIWHDEGIVGLTFFLYLLGVVSVCGVGSVSRMLKCRSDMITVSGKVLQADLVGKPEFLIGGLAAISGLIVSNAFSLSLRYVSTGFHFWFLLGMLSAQASAGSPAIIIPLMRRKTGNANDRLAGNVSIPLTSRIAVLLITGGVVAATVFSIRLLIADIFMAKALDHSKRAYVAVEDDDSEIFHDTYVEGTLYNSDMNEWEKAIAYYIKVLRYNPHNLRAHYMLGNAFNRREITEKQYQPKWGDNDGIARNDIERALTQYNYVIAQAPNYTEVDYEIGNAFMKLGDVDKAIEYYSHYARYRRFFTKIHYALAQAFVAKRDWESAEKAYDDVLELNKKFTRAYLELSAVCHMIGKHELADDYYHKATELSPDYANVTIVEIYESFREWGKALDHLGETITKSPADPSLYSKQGWLYIQLNDYDKAIQAYTRCAALDSLNAFAYINLSNLYYTVNDLDNAKVSFEKALAIDPAAVKRAMQSETTAR